MVKFWKLALLSVVTIFVAYVGYAFWQVRSLEIEQLEDNLFVIRGVGGNVTVIKTNAGTVVVDSMTFPMQGNLIRDKAEQLTGSEVTLLINTHYHLDHTHGNPGFKPGTQIVATDRTLSHLKALDADFWEGDTGLLLPNDTFSDQRTFKLGDTIIKVMHLGRGHTDGDLVVLIENYQTIVMGDLFFNQHYPNIDLEAGGSVQQWPATIDKVLALDFKRVIPGHGDTTGRNGLRQFQAFMADLRQIGQTANSTNTNLEDTLKQAKFDSDAGYAEIAFVGIPLGLDREFVITRAWEEATNNFDLRN